MAMATEMVAVSLGQTARVGLPTTPGQRSCVTRVGDVRVKLPMTHHNESMTAPAHLPRRIEVLAGLSVAIDLGLGQPQNTCSARR